MCTWTLYFTLPYVPLRSCWHGLPRQVLATHRPTMRVFADAFQDPGEAGPRVVVHCMSGAVSCFFAEPPDAAAVASLTLYGL